MLTLVISEICRTITTIAAWYIGEALVHKLTGGETIGQAIENLISKS